MPNSRRLQNKRPFTESKEREREQQKISHTGRWDSCCGFKHRIERITHNRKERINLSVSFSHACL